MLTDQQVRRYRQWMRNAERFDQIVQQLQELSAQADAILRGQERPEPQPKRSPRSRS